MRTRDRKSLCLILSLLVLVGIGSLSTSHAQQRQQRRPVRRDSVQASEDRVLQIFALKYIPADGDLVKKLSALLPGVVLAMDSRTNSVIIQSDAKQVDRAKELLAALDVPAASKDADPAHRDRQVRIIWLMSGLEKGDPLPQDMAPIVDELRKYGVTGLQLVTQTMVRGRNQFTTSAYPDLDGKPVRLEINGTFSSQNQSGDNAELEISLSASTTSVATDTVRQSGRATNSSRKSSKESLALLETTVLAPFGHPVVLCMTPIKKMTSVFIVQILLAR